VTEFTRAPQQLGIAHGGPVGPRPVRAADAKDRRLGERTAEDPQAHRRAPAASPGSRRPTPPRTGWGWAGSVPGPRPAFPDETRPRPPFGTSAGIAVPSRSGRQGQVPGLRHEPRPVLVVGKALPVRPPLRPPSRPEPERPSPWAPARSQPQGHRSGNARRRSWPHRVRRRFARLHHDPTRPGPGALVGAAAPPPAAGAPRAPSSRPGTGRHR